MIIATTTIIIILMIIINDEIDKCEKNMSAVKKPYGCGDKGPPEPLSPAAAPLTCQDAVERMFPDTKYLHEFVAAKASDAKNLPEDPFQPVCHT